MIHGPARFLVHDPTSVWRSRLQRAPIGSSGQGRSDAPGAQLLLV